MFGGGGAWGGVGCGGGGGAGGGGGVFKEVSNSTDVNLIAISAHAWWSFG